ncbi:MAG: DedA family protein, partial [Aeromonas sp.]
MLDMLMAIWHQDFDALIQMQAVPLLISCLMLVLLLESAFVFLPLPGDSLVLLAGGLVGMGVLGPEVTLVYLPLAAGMGSLVAYLQGRALQRTRFMEHIERILPADSLPKAARLLSKYGFLAMFSSRFIPFVRVLTPMLMGIGRLSVLRMA